MAERETDKIKPVILAQEVVAQSKLFKIEQLSLQFSNGEQRIFERMRGSGRGAVMVVACPDPEHFYLIREYCAGTDNYQLGFPKGLIDPGEDAMQAANRELKEEAGFGARQLIALKAVSLAPGYFNATMQLVLATGLYAEQLPGDEPEPLELVPWSWQQLDALLAQPDFTEARSIAALFLAKKYLDRHQDVFE